MTPKKFIEKLVSSYPPSLRPDREYIDEIYELSKKRNLSGEQWDLCLTMIVEAFRYFPTIHEISQCMNDVPRRMKSQKHSESAMEYFEVDGHQYARPVEISATGQLIRKDLPEGATKYKLWVPESMQKNEEYLTFDQAYEEGVVSEEFYSQILANMPAKKKNHDDRFRKIGNIIKTVPEKADDDWGF
jgi:hypothetical protein